MNSPIMLPDAFAFRYNTITIKVNLSARLLHIINSQKNTCVDRLVQELNQFEANNYSHHKKTEKVFHIPEAYDILAFKEACVNEIKKDFPLMKVEVEIFNYNFKESKMEISKVVYQ